MPHRELADPSPAHPRARRHKAREPRGCRARPSDGWKSMRAPLQWKGTSPSAALPFSFYFWKTLAELERCSATSSRLKYGRRSHPRAPKSQRGLWDNRALQYHRRNGNFRSAEDQGTASRTRVRRERCLLLGASKGRGAGRKGQPPAAENKSQASPSQGCIGKSPHVI